MSQLSLRIPKDSIIKLNQHQNKELVIKFNGGREVWGQLKSWDKGMNMVMDSAIQLLGFEDKDPITRELGLIIIKGSQIQSIALKNGYIIIDNPYQNEQLDQ